MRSVGGSPGGGLEGAGIFFAGRGGPRQVRGPRQARPLCEEFALLTAGILAALGVFNIYWAIVVGGLACLAGDLIVFAVGKRVGFHLHDHPRLRRMMRGRALLRARHLYVRRGPWALSIARLLPGLKTPFLFTAGALRMSWPKFLFLDLVSVIFFAPTLVLLAYHFSLSLAQLQTLVRGTGLLIIPLFLGVLGTLVALWALARRRRIIRRTRRFEEMGMAPQPLGDLPSPLPEPEPAETVVHSG